MSRRLKLTLIAAFAIAMLSYWFANPEMSWSNFRLLPLNASGTVQTALSWLARGALVFAVAFAAKFVLRKNVNLTIVASPDDADQAVIINIKLSSDGMPSSREVDRMHAFEATIEKIIKRCGTGELDGDEFGEGYCTIYLYGPSAETLYQSVEPAIKELNAPVDSFVIRRFGKPGAKEVRTSLNSPLTDPNTRSN